MRPALLAAAWTVCALAAGAAGFVRPSEVFMPPGKELALLPDGMLLGVVEAALPGFQTAEDCAASCSQALGAGAACDFMAFCGRVVSAISRNGRPGPVCSPPPDGQAAVPRLLPPPR